jgi:SAM-dependent methyltransferase
MTVLDIGCGPADILAYMRDVDYLGFDINDAYIQRARALYGQRAKFECRELADAEIEKMPLFDTVLAQGLIHHLDDEAAIRTMKLAYKALKPGGRFLTVDPCLDSRQNPIARLLVSYDRGQHVRNRMGYTSLAQLVFKSTRIEIRHQSWIPYTHCYMECTRW